MHANAAQMAQSAPECQPNRGAERGGRIRKKETDRRAGSTDGADGETCTKGALVKQLKNK